MDSGLILVFTFAIIFSGALAFGIYIFLYYRIWIRSLKQPNQHSQLTPIYIIENDDYETGDNDFIVVTPNKNIAASNTEDNLPTYQQLFPGT